MISLRKKLASVVVGGALLATGAAGAYAFTGSASAQAASTTTAASSDSSSTAPATSDSTATSNSAATPNSATANDPADTDAPGKAGGRHQFDPSQGGHVGANGVKEQLLTGDVAEKAKAAALAAVPGGTIERVENDAEGATYEAHMTKADGSHVTVKLDASFNVTNIETNAH